MVLAFILLENQNSKVGSRHCELDFHIQLPSIVHETITEEEGI